MKVLDFEFLYLFYLALSSASFISVIVSKCFFFQILVILFSIFHHIRQSFLVLGLHLLLFFIKAIGYSLSSLNSLSGLKDEI